MARALRIHHLNCGSMCPLGGWLMDGRSHGVHGHLVCHCLLIETPSNGLVLVDTGLGQGDVAQPYPRLSPLYVNLLNIQLDAETTAVRQIARLGFSARDVRHIVLTHLDFDHAGGLEDFPAATVHVLARELEAARSKRSGFVGRRRYRPEQWDDVHRWKTYVPGDGSTWFGFQAVRQLDGLPPEVLILPLAGHTWGHAGIAVQDGTGWLLHAGDAYFHRDELRCANYRCPAGLRAYQRLMEVDRNARLTNQFRLRALARQHREVRVVCGHDASELAACREGRALTVETGDLAYQG
jgi:glyoxylase-like metal-dependent hydrolase (beta-lactamase superfamily II)